MAHIESELALAGMRAARHVTSHEVSPADLSQAAQSEGARAVLRVQSEGIEVWLFDPSQPSGRRLSFVELVPKSLGGDAILALRASEIARAAVIVEPPAAAVAPVAARDDGARDPRVNDAPPLTRWHGSAGPLALFAGGQSTAMPMLAAHVGYALSPSFRLEIGGAIPLAGALIERADGNAALTVHEVFGDVLVDLFPSSGSWISPHVLGGGAIVAFAAEGDVKAPLTARSGSAIGPAVFVGAGAVATLTSYLGLRADATLGTTVAPLRVSFAARDTVEWGRPLAGLQGSLEARF